MLSYLLPPEISYAQILSYGLVSAAAGLALTIVTPILVIVPLQLHRISFAPDNVPWVGQRSYGFFPKLRSTLAALKYERQNLEEGWAKYSSKGKPFVRPSLHWPSVVLPPSNAEWLAHQPENAIAATKAQDEILALEWLASGPSNAFIHDFTVIRRDLTRQINACVPEILDEIRYAFDLHFTMGKDTGDGWKDVLIVDAIRKAVCGVSNRVIVGLPICRSEEYFHAVSRWWICFGLTGLVFRSFIPGPLQRFIMPVLSLPTWFWRRKVADMYEPEVARRIKVIQEAKAKGVPLDKNADDRHNDLMQWLVEQSIRSHDPAEMDPRNLSNKLVLFNLFATHTITTVLTTLFTTLLTHEFSNETLAALREEAAQILPNAAEASTITRQMPLHDSVLRETLRLNPSFDDALLREVVAPAGLTTPEGVYLPQGSHVAMHTRLMQRSDWMGEGQDWSSFQPFRYSELAADRHEAQKQATRGALPTGDDATEEEKATALPADKGQVSAVQISDKFLPFGLGRHACPGRFFAANTLKLMLAYLVLNFDMQPFPADKQPEYIEFGGVSLLLENTTVKMRRREEEKASDVA
ncbi:hypothetical protein Q7P37_006835 [Cladosporium fusiforme]